MRPIRRRTFLSAAAVGIAGFVSAGAQRAGAFWRPPPRSTRTATPSDLVGSFFSDAEATRRIGTAYLQVAPTEASETALITALAPPGEDPAQWWASIDLAALQKEVRRRAHRDFKTPDVVDIGGWQLARTEARLAALWVVTHP
jgi:hypothetical protein